MQEQTAQPSPFLLFETINVYQRTAVIKAAIELDIFTAIAKGNETAPAIAEACGTAERGARMLCDYLVVIGFLTKEGSQYRLTQDSVVFLDRRSPAYMGGVIEFLLSPMVTEAFDNLTGAVRKGGTALPEEGSVAPEHPVWVSFARAMAPITTLPAQVIFSISGAGAARGLRLLDVAAGHGMYGITFAQNNPTAEVTALDWPQVLEVAKENARAAGVIERFKTIEGSAFDADFGGGYDIVLLTNFLHHFDAPTCAMLLKKVHAALAEGGRAITLEFVPNDDRVSPPNSAMFSIVMLAATPGGDAYTFAELSCMFEDAGFSRSEMHEMPGGIQRVMISHK